MLGAIAVIVEEVALLNSMCVAQGGLVNACKQGGNKAQARI